MIENLDLDSDQSEMQINLWQKLNEVIDFVNDENKCNLVDTTPQMLKPITEHPDVQRLVGQVVELQAENERLKNDKLKPCVTCDAFQRIDRLEEVLKRMLLLKCDDKCEDEHGLSETIYFVPRSMIDKALKEQTND